MLQQGSIAWAIVTDPTGKAKKRPIVIISPTEEILFDNSVSAVAISTTYPDPPPAGVVELPWYSRGHPVTGLLKRSAAICEWVVRVRPSEIVEVKGAVPKQKLLEIVRRVRELSGDDPIARRP